MPYLFYGRAMEEERVQQEDSQVCILSSDREHTYYSFSGTLTTDLISACLSAIFLAYWILIYFFTSFNWSNEKTQRQLLL